MAAIELVSGQVTVPTAVFGAVATVFSSGTGVVRNFSTGNAWLLTMWQNQNTTSGAMRVRSPRLHDFVNGIRLQSVFANPMPQYPFGFPQRLVAQDTLTIEISGSAVAGDIVNFALLIYYDSLDSANGRFIDLTELENRMVNVFTVTHALVGNVAAVYGAAQAISAGAADTTKANTDYALLGGTCSESAAGNGCAIGMTGVDTGNLRLGFPVLPNDSEVTSGWFIDLCKRFGRPMIPVVNAANKAGTLLDVLINENADTVTVSTIWAELR